MNIFNVLELEISEKDHVILSADQGVYDALKTGDHGIFDDYIDESYMRRYLKGLEEADGNWFTAGVLTDKGTRLYCLKARRNTKSNSIRISFASIDDLLDNHNYLVDTVASYKAELELYDDVYFEYNPDSQTILMANTQLADFDAGLYTLDEIESMLYNKVSETKRDRIKSFIGQLKSKAGRSTTRIEANLLNDDPTISATILNASYVFTPSRQERVIGHIHPELKRGTVQASALKRDSLTGLLDKADIIRIARDRIDERHLEGTTLAIIDIDFFKNINDTYGHQFGDTVIKRIADIISSEVGSNGIAGRFGGDEFLIVFYNITEEEMIRNHFRAIRDKVRNAFVGSVIDDSTPLTLSMGSATYSTDADNYEDLFLLADQCLYIAKDKGRNRYVIYNSSKHGTLEAIKQKEMTRKKFNERGDLSYGEMIVKMFDVVHNEGGTTPQLLMDEFALAFHLQRMSLLVGTPFRLKYATGSDVIPGLSSPDVLLGVLNSDVKEKYLAGRNFLVVNRLDSLPPQAGAIKTFLKEIGVLSYLLMRFWDKDQNECFIIFSSVGKATQWNETHFMYYRAFSDLLSRFSLKDI